MNKVMIFGGAALAALLPAVAGLTANPSLSQSVPVPRQEVQLVEDSPTATPTASGTARPSASATHGSGPTRTADDHGGDRNRGSDDSGTGSHD